MVIAHPNCGACHMNGQQMKELMLQRGIHQDVIDIIGLCGINLDHWLISFFYTSLQIYQKHIKTI
jgi:carbonic anhydrase